MGIGKKLTEMGPVPVLADHVIAECVENGVIKIDPFREERIGPTAYRLFPYRVRQDRVDEENGVREDGEYIEWRTLSRRDGYFLRPGEHVVVELEERIVVDEGLFGDFYPASYLIENGLMLTCGRLDARYSLPIRFGLCNMSPHPFKLGPRTQIARISFGWLGLENIPDYEFAEYDEELRSTRDVTI